MPAVVRHLALWSCRSNGFVGRAIRLQTWGDVNHSAVEWVEDGCYLDIQPGGVKLRPVPAVLAPGTGEVVHRFVFATTAEAYDASLAFARTRMVGKGYDFVSVGRFLVPLRRALGRLEPAVRSTTERFFCSEGAEIVFRKHGLALVRPSRPTSQISPQDQFDSVRLEQALRYERWEHGRRLYQGPVVGAEA